MTTTTQNNEKAAPAVQIPVADLRDYFAAKAMQAMLSGHFGHYGHEEYWDRDAIACEAYFAADAMLKERAK